MANDLQSVNVFMMRFTTQKNGVTVKNTGNKASGDPLLCPKASLLRQVIHQRAHRTPPSTPLARVMTPVGSWENNLD